MSSLFFSAGQGPCGIARSVPKLVACIVLLFAPGSVRADIQWEPAWHATTNGQRYSVETFTSRRPVDVVVKRIALEKGVFDRYLVADGRMLLSGVREGQHWLAEVLGTAEGTTGYVSALYFDPAGISVSPVMAGRGTHFQFDEAGAYLSVEVTGAHHPLQRVRLQHIGEKAARFTVSRAPGPDLLVSIMEP